MQVRLHDTRRALYEVHKAAEKALKVEKDQIKAVTLAVATLPPTAAMLFPSGFAGKIALPRERFDLGSASVVVTKRHKGETNAACKRTATGIADL
jgi:hypothetical protein